MYSELNPTNLNSGACPSCKARGLKVLASQRNRMANSTCRRYECNKCHFRFTRYEVSDAFFKQAIENERILNKLKTYMDKISSPANKPSKSCSNCEYNVDDMCNFEVPEYDTEDAADCNYYKLKWKASLGKLQLDWDSSLQEFSGSSSPS